jgi:hypothetical protein
VLAGSDAEVRFHRTIYTETGMIPTLIWTNDGVRFLDQTKLPLEESFVLATDYEQVANVITTMVVRGRVQRNVKMFSSQAAVIHFRALPAGVRISPPRRRRFLIGAGVLVKPDAPHHVVESGIAADGVEVRMSLDELQDV